MTDGASGRGRAALVSGDVEFTDRDATLLREIGQTGSVARAASNLDRSRGRALGRIETLEDAFGSLVERRRGGPDGGGSRLTDDATALVARLSRLQAAISATAGVPEIVLPGVVSALEGELAAVETPIGTVRGLHDGAAVQDDVQVSVGADAVTVSTPSTDRAAHESSARNHVQGTITHIDGGETVATLSVDVHGTEVGAMVTVESAERLGLRPGRTADLTWKATATRLVDVAGDPEPSASNTGADIQ